MNCKIKNDNLASFAMEGTIKQLGVPPYQANYKKKREVCDKKLEQKKQKNMHLSGIEPGSPAWKASIMPLDHKCFYLLKSVHNFLYFKQSITDLSVFPSFVSDVALPALGVPIRDHNPCFLSPILVH